MYSRAVTLKLLAPQAESSGAARGKASVAPFLKHLNRGRGWTGVSAKEGMWQSCSGTLRPSIHPK